jgi:hypothetical protein
MREKQTKASSIHDARDDAPEKLTKHAQAHALAHAHTGWGGGAISASSSCGISLALPSTLVRVPVGSRNRNGELREPLCRLHRQKPQVIEFGFLGQRFHANEKERNRRPEWWRLQRQSWYSSLD